MNVVSNPIQESLLGFGQRLREARERLGLSGAQLSAQVGVQRSTVAQYEAGRAFPSFGVLKNLTRVLGVSIDRLVFDEYEVAGEIQDKELLEYFARLDRLTHRERTQVKDFIDGILAREELEQLKKVSRRRKRVA